MKPLPCKRDASLECTYPECQCWPAPQEAPSAVEAMAARLQDQHFAGTLATECTLLLRDLQSRLDAMKRERDEERRRSDAFLRYGDHEAELRRAAEQRAEGLEMALQSIVETHDMFCEHHVGVSQHAYNLCDIAKAALDKKGAP